MGLTQKDAANQLQGRTGDVPGIVIAGATHELAVEKIEGNEEEDEGQQVDRRLHGRCASRELVVQRQVKYPNEATKGGKHSDMKVSDSTRIPGGKLLTHGEEEADHRPALPEMHREQTVRPGSSDEEKLLKNEENG